MGWMTTLTILNDGWITLKKYPETLVEVIDNNMMRGGSMGSIEVMPSHHADDFRLYSTYANSTFDLSKWNPDLIKMCRDREHMRKHILGNIERARRILSDLEDELLTMVD